MRLQNVGLWIADVSHAEECNCPQKDLNMWLDDLKCPLYDQIKEDLKSFQRVAFSKLYPVIMQRFNQPDSMSICNYIVKKNQVKIMSNFLIFVMSLFILPRLLISIHFAFENIRYIDDVLGNMLASKCSLMLFFCL